MKSSYLLSLLLIVFTAAGENTWSKTIGQDDGCIYSIRDVVELSDGSLVISFAGPFEDPFLICFDTEGNILWNKHILEKGGTSRAFESCGNLLALEDGFAAYYHSEPRATGINTDVAVVRFSNSGEILWKYILGENDDSNWMCTDMIYCSDRGLLVIGCPGTMLPGGFAFKLSQEGDLEWQTSPDEIAGYALSVVETLDGDFLILVDECPDSIDLQMVSEEGVVSPPVTISETGMCFSGKISGVNGSLCFFSSVESNRFKAFYLDSNFEIGQIVEFELTPESNGILTEITEKGLLVAGSTEYGNALLSMFDLNGNLIWHQVYDTGREEFLAGARWMDEGILAFGRIQNPPVDDGAFWILKTDNLGSVEGADTADSGIQIIDPSCILLELH